jgi:hypothetical protein
MKINVYRKHMRITIGMIGILLSFLIMDVSHATSTVHEGTKTNQRSTTPPTNVMSIIKRVCPSCKPVTFNDLAEEARDEFLDMYPNANPGWVAGDFNGDGLTDYAVLLSNRKNGKSYLRLIVLLATSANTFSAKTVIEKYKGHSFWYIGLMPAGTIAKHTQAFSPRKNAPYEVKLKYPAIKYYKAGSSMSVLYFENGTFHGIPVSY